MDRLAAARESTGWCVNSDSYFSFRNKFERDSVSWLAVTPVIESSPDLSASYTAERQPQTAKLMFKGWKAVVLFCRSVLIRADQEGEISCFNISQWGGKKTHHLLKAVLNNVNDVWLIISFYEEDLKTDTPNTLSCPWKGRVQVLSIQQTGKVLKNLNNTISIYIYSCWGSFAWLSLVVWVFLKLQRA